MASNRDTPPPLSLRTIKVQQKCWNNCSTPPFELFDPVDQYSPLRNSAQAWNIQKSAENSPNSIRYERWTLKLDMFFLMILLSILFTFFVDWRKRSLRCKSISSEPAIRKKITKESLKLFIECKFYLFCSLFHFISHIKRTIDSQQKRSKSPMRFSYSKQYSSTGSSDHQQLSVEDSPRSPKIIYSKPSPTYDPAASQKMPTSPSRTFFEPRSPSYSPYEPPASPRKSPNSPKKFVFDAVSPRCRSNGKKQNNHFFPIQEIFFIQVKSIINAFRR